MSTLVSFASLEELDNHKWHKHRTNDMGAFRGAVAILSSEQIPVEDRLASLQKLAQVGLQEHGLPMNTELTVFLEEAHAYIDAHEKPRH